MSDGEAFRPRRAWQPEEEEIDLSGLDDTPAEAAGPARRGSDGDLADDIDPEIVETPDPVEVPWTPEEPISASSASGADARNPFARPGSDAAAEPIPATSLSQQAVQSETIIPAPVFPRSAGEFADGPGPAPRRSALSSTTPVEPESPASPVPAQPWVAPNGGLLAKWAVAGVALAVVVGLLSFFISRETRPVVQPSPVVTESASPSASPSPTKPPLDAAALLTEEDLADIAPASSWAVTNTTTSAVDHTGRGACLSTEEVEVNAVTSLQRLLATSGDDQLAALHQIDVYATPQAAQEVLEARASALANCAEVPALIVRSSTVTGLGDDARQVTIAFENDPVQYHTVLLSRVGAAVQLIDFARNDTPVDAPAMAAVLARPQESLCEYEEADCSAPLSITDAPVPAAEPLGWLIEADIPRIRLGAGRWAGQEAVDEISASMGCENMTLATEPGPSTRQQRTFLMTQDDEAPSTFGIDEVMLTFEHPDTAAQFVTRLGNNLATCANRVNTAKVTEHAAVPAVGKDGQQGSSRIFTITQATSDTETLDYQLIVSAAGTRIMYTLITSTEDYQFTQEQLAALGARIPVRASQLQ